MKTSEAYKKLELSDNATPEEIQAAFRKQAKKYHPDKKDGDEVKFKEINEAYQTLTNPKQSPGDFDNDGDPFGPGGFGINFNPFGSGRQIKQIPNIIVNVDLTFNESVLGCEKEIKCHRHIMCNDCSGNGFETLADNCSDCGGKGNKVIKQMNMVFMMTCDKCNGVGKKTQDCKKCKGDGATETDMTINVKLPQGVPNNQKIRLQGAGNYVAPGFNTDVILNPNVESDADMSLDGNDVVSTLEVSLLEALEGTSKKVRTVKGEHTLKIPAKIRNKEKLSVSGYGANGGNHVFNLDVKYPNDVSEIINLLK